MIPDFSALTMFLNTHLWIFFGLYCLTPLLCFVLAGTICSSIEWLDSSSVFKQLFRTISSNGLILNNLSFLFSGRSFVELSVTCMYRRNVSYCFSKNQVYVHSSINALVSSNFSLQDDGSKIIRFLTSPI